MPPFPLSTLLISRLDKGRKKRVTLVSAPAGFGKTTLAVQWLDQITGHWAWLSLDQRDNDPERFLRSLDATLCSAFPAACPKVETLLSAVESPPPDYLAEALISDLAGIKYPLCAGNRRLPCCEVRTGPDDRHSNASAPPG